MHNTVENNNKELKARSFRVSDEVAEKIKEIAFDLGGNQQLAMATLIEAYEYSKAKEVYSDVKKEKIDKFDSCINSLRRYFIDAIEDEDNAIELAKGEVDALLRTKDEIIAELKNSNKELLEQLNNVEPKIEAVNKEMVVEIEKRDSQIDKLTAEFNSKSEQCLKLKSDFEDMQDKYKEADKKESEIRALYDQNIKKMVQLQNDVTKLQKSEMEYKDIIGKVTNERNSLQQKNDKMEIKIASLEDDIEALKDTVEAEKALAVKHATLEIKEQILRESEKEIKEYRQEADKYKNKYFELKEKNVK